MSLFLLIQIWMCSIDIVFRIANEYLSRRDEYEADGYAVKIGFGPSLKSGLIRNFQSNQDNIFASRIHQALTKGHPTLLQRIRHIDRVIA